MLKDYVRHYWICRRDAAGDGCGLGLVLPADNKALRLSVNQNWWAPRAYVQIELIAFGRWGGLICEHRSCSSVRISLPRRLCFHRGAFGWAYARGFCNFTRFLDAR